MHCTKCGIMLEFTYHLCWQQYCGPSGSPLTSVRCCDDVNMDDGADLHSSVQLAPSKRATMKTSWSIPMTNNLYSWEFATSFISLSGPCTTQCTRNDCIYLPLLRWVRTVINWWLDSDKRMTSVYKSAFDPYWNDNAWLLEHISSFAPIELFCFIFLIW
jgi:hypothetical protein